MVVWAELMITSVVLLHQEEIVERDVRGQLLSWKGQGRTPCACVCLRMCVHNYKHIQEHEV